MRLVSTLGLNTRVQKFPSMNAFGVDTKVKYPCSNERDVDTRGKYPCSNACDVDTRVKYPCVNAFSVCTKMKCALGLVNLMFFIKNVRLAFTKRLFQEWPLAAFKGEPA